MKEKAIGMALTTDIWTSVAVEETFSFPERHTGVNIAEKLQELA